MIWLLYIEEKRLWYSFDKMLDGPQSQFRYYGGGGKKNPSPCWELNLCGLLAGVPAPVSEVYVNVLKLFSFLLCTLQCEELKFHFSCTPPWHS